MNTIPIVLTNNRAIDKIISQGSTPKGKRAIIVIGEVNGIIEHQNKSLLSACPAVINPTI